MGAKGGGLLVKPGRPGHQDDILLRLLRGPALASELPHGKVLHQQISALNKTLKHAGRHIDSRPVKGKGRFGLTIVDREYRLVKIAAACLFIALLAPQAFAKSEHMTDPHRYVGSAQKNRQLMECLDHVQHIKRFAAQEVAQQDFDDWLLAHKGNPKADTSDDYVRRVSEMIAIYFAAESQEPGSGHHNAMARCMGTGV